MSALRPPRPPRPLPARFSLELERKDAKALLRRLRAGDPDAMARARERHPAIDTSSPASIKLSDAQLVIAREYGFASWPRLVRYVGDVERQRHAPKSIRSEGREFFDGIVRSLIAEHRGRHVWTARELASYVPRFYGMPLDEIFAASITEDDARLAVARSYGFSTWEGLLEGTAEQRRRQPSEWEVHPLQYASKAMEAGDLAELKRVVAAHPELLHPSEVQLSTGQSMIRSALHHDRRKGAEAMRPIMEWLEAQGFDLQRELNRQLCGHMRMKAEKVRWLLDRGADPRWVSPNGVPVLEHALIRYWNGDAVDVVAAGAVPRKALWIAAGLGDVDGVRRSLDGGGKPTSAARRLRPDFDAVGFRGGAPLPNAGHEEILMEAFFIAMLNGRTPVLEYMVSRGFPLDSLIYETPIINIAVGNGMVPVVECLVRCGASLDLRGWRPRQSARELAGELFGQTPQDTNRRRIAELCGVDLDAVLAERESRVVEPGLAVSAGEALELAADDAFRLGQTDVRAENLLFGLLRVDGLALQFFGKVSRMDFERFRADVDGRVGYGQDRVERPKLPLHAEAQAVVQLAIAIAKERRRDTLTTLHLLYALTRSGEGVAADLLTRYGSSAAALNAELERAL